jgi:hypothetical protein
MKNTKRSMIICVIVLLLSVIFLNAEIQAATLEVGVGKPYTTIQSAINATSSEDTVLVYDGTYVENIQPAINAAINLDKAITVKSVNGAASTIIDANRSGAVVYMKSGEIDGFTIQNGRSRGISCVSGSPSVKNCIITGTVTQVINFGVDIGVSSASFINCIITGNGSATAFAGGGVSCGGAASPSFINCIISSNTGGVYYGKASGAGMYIFNNSSPAIINCTITNNYAASSYLPEAGGIHCERTSSPIVVNSIIWGNTAGGLPSEICVDETSTINLTYSDIQGGWIGTGNIDANPLFIGGGDYHLQANSPCIDKGTSSGAPDYDIDGNARPYGASDDMGADEYMSSTLIALSSFTANPYNQKVILSWTTESEIDNAGFNLYRSETENGNYTKINFSLIPANGSSTQGASYEHIDKNVQNRKTYWYKLEDIDLNGTSTMHGPKSATPRWFLSLWN